MLSVRAIVPEIAREITSTRVRDEPSLSEGLFRVGEIQSLGIGCLRLTRHQVQLSHM